MIRIVSHLIVSLNVRLFLKMTIIIAKPSFLEVKLPYCPVVCPSVRWSIDRSIGLS